MCVEHRVFGIKENSKYIDRVGIDKTNKLVIR